MKINSRSYTAADYSHRYGFNSMTEDNELKGEGNSLDFGARFYDPRVGRFLSLDPMMEKYPNISPYAAFANNPVMYVDPDGRELWITPLNATQSFSDITSLLPSKYRTDKSVIDVQSDGKIIFNINNISTEDQRLSGVQLINKLCNPGFIIEYKASNVTVGKSRTDKERPFTYYITDPDGTRKDLKGSNVKNSITNLSTTPYLPFKKQDEPFLVGDNLPIKQGSVRICPGQFYMKNSLLQRPVVVFHELAENLFRTLYELTYYQAHDRAWYDGKAFSQENQYFVYDDFKVELFIPSSNLDTKKDTESLYNFLFPQKETIMNNGSNGEGNK